MEKQTCEECHGHKRYVYRHRLSEVALCRRCYAALWLQGDCCLCHRSRRIATRSARGKKPICDSCQTKNRRFARQMNQKKEGIAA